MKDSPITIGFDDAKFKLKSSKNTTLLIGVVCQGTRMVRVNKKEITVDGNDATQAIIDLSMQNIKHVQYILTDSITFGGFNLIDLEKIHAETKKPVISITEREVNLQAVQEAIVKRFPNNFKEKLEMIIKAGNLYHTEISTAGGISRVFFHSKGINYDEVTSLLEKISIDTKLPEPIRMAHLIGKMF